MRASGAIRTLFMYPKNTLADDASGFSLGLVVGVAQLD
jgi:hypothetical protein